MMASTRSVSVDTDAIVRNILVIRGQRVLLDSDLAALYQVATKALTRAVRRNPGRFPADFMFQLAVEESASLRSQSGALKTGRGKCTFLGPSRELGRERHRRRRGGRDSTRALPWLYEGTAHM